MLASSSARYPLFVSAASITSAGGADSATISRNSSSSATKSLTADSRTGGDAVGLVAAAQRLRERDALTRRQRLDARLGPVADAALRHVEDAAQRHGVFGIDQHPQVGEQVAHLAALVEPHAADHLVRQPDPDEDLFEDPRLRVGAVEDRDVAVAGTPPRRAAGRSLRRRTAPRRARRRRRSRRSARRRRRRTTGSSPCGPRCLRDDRVGRGQDRLGRAVVLLEQDRRWRRGSRARTPRCCGSSRPGTRRSTGRRRPPRRARPAGRRDPARTRSPSTVRFSCCGSAADQLAHQRVLRVVRVLVLVDQHVPEAPPIVLGDVGEGLEQVDRRP